jgi:hypothetical protein
MSVKHSIALFVIILALLPMSFAEIVIQTATTSEPVQTATKGNQDTHTFIVNKYYTQTTIPQQPGTEIKIMIQQNISEVKINQCAQANFSFKITNPSSKSQIYSFSVKDFTGTAYITPNLLLNSKQSKIVSYTLLPDCSLVGIANPKIHVETEDKSEEADIPVILKIESTQPQIDDTKCESFYSKTICESNYYLRFNEDTTYNLDLSKWFYDPDGDKLTYSTKQGVNLDIQLKGEIAKIKPRRDWYGTEEVLFYATDNKGGKAESKKFYVQVLDTEERFSIGDFFSRLFS